MSLTARSASVMTTSRFVAHVRQILNNNVRFNNTRSVRFHTGLFTGRGQSATKPGYRLKCDSAHTRLVSPFQRFCWPFSSKRSRYLAHGSHHLVLCGNMCGQTNNKKMSVQETVAELTQKCSQIRRTLAGISDQREKEKIILNHIKSQASDDIRIGDFQKGLHELTVIRLYVY